jgi:hypothetical protein
MQDLPRTLAAPGAFPKLGFAGAAGTPAAAFMALASVDSYPLTPPLSRGVAEFEYAFGAARNVLVSEAGSEYGRPAFIAMYRTGMTDHMTVGGHAEGVDKRVTVGLDLDIGGGDYGVINGNVGAIRTDTGNLSPASAMRYNFSRGALRVTAGYERKPDGSLCVPLPGAGTVTAHGVVETFGGRIDYTISHADSIAFATDRSLPAELAAIDALPQTTTRLIYSYSAGKRFGMDGLVGYAAGTPVAQRAPEGWIASVNFRWSLGR